MRDLSTHNAACFAGKLVDLFDPRRQRWARLEWRKDVHENCRVDMLDFLQGLSVGSLLVFDLGYFSFPFFDMLTDRKLWWVSHYRENTSYSIAYVFYRHREQLDALIWLGQAKSKCGTSCVWCDWVMGSGSVGISPTCVIRRCPRLRAVAQLYARRWDIELAFHLLKEYLGMSHWWSSKQELILIQMWVVLILSHIVYALRERIALAVDCDPFEVSAPTLVDLLPRLWGRSPLQFEQLIQTGRHVGLLRERSTSRTDHSSRGSLTSSTSPT